MQELDGFEARLGGKLKAIEERNLVEQHCEVCGETWHVSSPALCK
jgi:hypothetical protein